MATVTRGRGAGAPGASLLGKGQGAHPVWPRPTFSTELEAPLEAVICTTSFDEIRRSAVFERIQRILSARRDWRSLARAYAA